MFHGQEDCTVRWQELNKEVTVGKGWVHLRQQDTLGDIHD